MRGSGTRTFLCLFVQENEVACGMWCVLCGERKSQAASKLKNKSDIQRQYAQKVTWVLSGKATPQ